MVLNISDAVLWMTEEEAEEYAEEVSKFDIILKGCISKRELAREHHRIERKIMQNKITKLLTDSCTEYFNNLRKMQEEEENEYIYLSK